MEISEIREWVQLLFVVTGGVIAVLAYYQNLKQRRVENSLKFIQLFRDGLHENDMHYWESLMRTTSEPSGAPFGYYASEHYHDFRPLDDWFSEGSEDDHAISRMAESLDVICHQVVSNTADAKTIYYELGQLLNTMHAWLEAIPYGAKKETLLESFPSIKRFYKKYQKSLGKWPSRIYAYIE